MKRYLLLMVASLIAVAGFSQSGTTGALRGSISGGTLTE
jgi:hypothetical protein